MKIELLMDDDELITITQSEYKLVETFKKVVCL